MMKIGIADPQARVRFGLHILLDQQPGWTVIGEVASCQELLELIRDGCPDLVLIDWDLPDLQTTNLIQLLREQFPDLIILMMSGRQEVNQMALMAKANAFACKTESPEKLLNLIRELQAQKRKAVDP